MPAQPQLKDHHNEARVFYRRLLVFAVLMIVLIAIVIAQLYNLQVVKHDDYVTLSDNNRVQVQALPPTRGLVFDRDGRLIADNRPSFTLTITAEQVDDLESTLEQLKPLVEFDEEDIEDFRKRLRQRRRPFEPVPLVYRLTEDEIARLAVQEYRLPGVNVAAELVRDYPFSELFAHTLGYVGRINNRELAGFSEEQYPRYSGTHTIGKIGIERQYEDILLGQVGSQYVEANAQGRVLRVLEQVPPEPGKNLQLFLDADVQRAAYEGMGSQRGAVVALDVRTGGVLAMVSTPSYNPNLFVTGISFADYRRLNESLDLPLFNRTIQGQYPPGSTVKPMLGLAGLSLKAVTPQTTVYDPGFFRLPGEKRLYRDWKRIGHGKRVDIIQAIVESCDTYFYDMAYKLGIDAMHDFGLQFSLGERTGIDIPSERPGIWPSRAWKRGMQGLAWYPGDTVNVGIGQGFVLSTPLQLAVMTATLANRGDHIQPRLVERIGDVETPMHEHQIEDISDEDWDLVFLAMEKVVHSVKGTASSLRKSLSYHMAGKTGTAQVVGIAQGEKYDSESLRERQRDHALFVAFAPVEEPRIAVAVIVENGEKSSRAAKVAKKVIDEYLIGEKIIAAPATEDVSQS